ncbi:uncharacterized protein Z518_11319 [Rhinocladiella mackenziei CBS 650.93]|uniref:BZIP domain-containing protein n=1 Tax=Rhinocladiella mackenziei CBS 650.93 TaxID=1442369 RepID=A0A0D2I8N6_9EURO|nr:uncharacterized protein Z518_11319 [Rhinocladiella mackenziei CBS 650.93]KIW99580.1 hypothetical protein Z518_11319 [Rhinocladiella mackenziei CBS 650.93]
MPRKPRSENPKEGKGNWKTKFTPQQLDRKRLVDRVGQRRNRELVKRKVTVLEERLRQAVRGDHNVLFQNLVEENSNLRSTLDKFETKMETILLFTQECLGMANTASTSANNRRTCSSPHDAPSEPAAEVEQVATPPSSDEDTNDRAYDRIAYDNSLPFLSSTMFQGTSLHHRENIPVPALEVSPEQIVEQVSNWKLLNQHGLGFDFLIRSCALDKEPVFLTTASVRQIIQSKTFYEDILDRLTPRIKPASPPIETSEESPPPQLSEMECQRRAVALCACEIVSRWRLLFRTRIECVSQFWALYRFYMFLVFPCYENLIKMPPWLWPTKAQLSQEHPGFIDCLIWPSLREKLINSWQNYNVKGLSIQLVRHFQIQNIDKQIIDIPLSVSSNPPGFVLDPNFEVVMYDLKNWTIGVGFLSQYPDLQLSPTANTNDNLNCLPIEAPIITPRIFEIPSLPAAFGTPKPRRQAMGQGSGQSPPKDDPHGQSQDANSPGLQASVPATERTQNKAGEKDIDTPSGPYSQEDFAALDHDGIFDPYFDPSNLMQEFFEFTSAATPGKHRYV